MQLLTRCTWRAHTTAKLVGSAGMSSGRNHKRRWHPNPQITSNDCTELTGFRQGDHNDRVQKKN
eukprot:1497063-Karenia_brevis.AAC.1